jgi:hypothetical protein
MRSGGARAKERSLSAWKMMTQDHRLWVAPSQESRQPHLHHLSHHEDTVNQCRMGTPEPQHGRTPVTSCQVLPSKWRDQLRPTKRQGLAQDHMRSLWPKPDLSSIFQSSSNHSLTLISCPSSFSDASVAGSHSSAWER